MTPDAVRTHVRTNLEASAAKQRGPGARVPRLKCEVAPVLELVRGGLFERRAQSYCAPWHFKQGETVTLVAGARPAPPTSETQTRHRHCRRVRVRMLAGHACAWAGILCAGIL